MNFRKNIHLFLFILLPLLLTTVAGCDFGKKKKTNWTLNLQKSSKGPYGLYLAFNSLNYLFPQAAVEEFKASSRLTNLGYKLRKNKGKSMLVMVGMNLKFSDGELDSLISFVEDGHQVMLAANEFDQSLLNQLQIANTLDGEMASKKMQTVYLNDKNNKPVAYTYNNKHHSIYRHFKYQDTGRRKNAELGKTEQQTPDFIVFSIGEGKLFLHASPICLTNYFLLQNNNRTYLDNLFGYVAEPVSNVYWSNFFYRESNKSDWSVIWNNAATRYALLLTLFALGVYLLFEIKRKQKIIPVVPPVENASVAFVVTIGRLYYNKKNHSNLAEKMVQHFLEFVRTNYYLNTNILDEEFVRYLAAKSGNSLAVTDSLIHNIKEVLNGLKADEAFLYALHTQIQDFYNGK